MVEAPRVVVSEPDPVASAGLSWLLREHGYDVVAARNEGAVLEALRAAPPDVLVLDWREASMEQRGVLEQLRTDGRLRHVRVIVAAPRGAPFEGGAEHRLPDLADDFLSRPFNAVEVLARLRAQLRGRVELLEARRALEQHGAALTRAQEEIAISRQLADILHDVSGEASATEIYRLLARRVARALDLTHCSVVLGAGNSRGVVVAAVEDPSITALETRLDRYPEIKLALESGRPVLVEDARTDPLFADVRALWAREGRDVPLRSVLTLPFGVDRERAGVLFLRTDRTERTLTLEDADFAAMIVRGAVAAIQRANALEATRADNLRLEALATTDPLTRLLNRRALVERLGREVDRARRFDSTVTMLLLDLDHFKGINDTAGHLVGDDILRQFAALLEDAVRRVDIAARYGGEEFVLILPETGADGGVVFAERLRERVEKHLFPVGAGDGIHLTVSIGVATFPSPRVGSVEDLFARADEALYRAKSGGRNQVHS